MCFLIRVLYIEQKVIGKTKFFWLSSIIICMFSFLGLLKNACAGNNKSNSAKSVFHSIGKPHPTVVEKSGNANAKAKANTKANANVNGSTAQTAKKEKQRRKGGQKERKEKKSTKKDNRRV